MIKSFGALAAFVLLSGTAVDAAPATPEEAQRLTTLLEGYVGHRAGQPGAVGVVPHGEGYTATLDLGRLLASSGYNVTAGPLTAELTPQADGQWRVAVDGIPLMGFTKGEQAFSMSVKDYKLDGMFDPKIQAFSSATTANGGATTHGTGPKGSMDTHVVETATGTLSGSGAGPGLVDIKSGQATKDFSETVDSSTPGATPDAPPKKLAFSVRAGDLTTATDFSGVHVAAINDLWTFLVTHASKEALVAAQADLKVKLKALLPIATAGTADVKVSDLSVTTQLGIFAAAAFAEHVEMAGPSAKDGVGFGLKLSGLTFPLDLLPPWASTLVPTNLDLSQTYGPVNLTPAATAAIDDFDLGADKPLTDEQQGALMDMLSQDGMVVTIAPSVIATPSLTVKLEGDIHIAKPLPTGSATVSVTGLDKTIELVRGSGGDDPNATQAIGFLSAMKVLAKAEGVDSYSWHIVAAPGAEITINGNPLSAPAAGGGGTPRPHKKKAEQNPTTPAK